MAFNVRSAAFYLGVVILISDSVVSHEMRSVVCDGQESTELHRRDYFTLHQGLLHRLIDNLAPSIGTTIEVVERYYHSFVYDAKIR